MEYKYSALVKFDSECASIPERERYFAFVEKYNAEAFGHERYGTSTLIFTTDKKMTKEKLAKALNHEIKVISLEQVLDENQKQLK